MPPFARRYSRQRRSWGPRASTRFPPRIAMASTSVHASWSRSKTENTSCCPEPEGLTEVNVRASVSEVVGQGGAASWARAIERFPSADRVLSTILTRQAEQYGDRVLFVSGETRWTYSQTVAVAAASAKLLADAGIRPGDRVALMCSNRPEFMQVYLGCAWLGAIAVPINTALRGIQLSHILRNSTPALLVVESTLLTAIETLDRDVVLPGQIWTIGEP